MADTDRFSTLEVLAKTIWGEARGEILEGQQAIACVVLNRVATKVIWWGRDIRSVCLTPFQFSCWLKKDPNYQKMLVVTDNDSVYAQCLAIAHSALTSTPQDVTLGADSYKRIGAYAGWAEDLEPVCIIGNHEFYKTIKVS